MEKKWSWKLLFQKIGVVLNSTATVITAVIKIVSCIFRGREGVA